jgi:pilus assembly protein CpaF
LMNADLSVRRPVAQSQGVDPDSLVVDRELVDQLADRVSLQLVSWVTEEQRRLQSTASVSTDSKRAKVVTWIRDEISRIDQSRIARSREPMSPEMAKLLRREVLAKIFDLGGLQTFMDRRDWTDLYVHGVEAWIRTLDGRKVFVGPIARTEEQVIELIQKIASTGGRSARQFNATAPLLSMRLPTGERLTANVGVSDVLTLAIRRQTFKSISLDELCQAGSFGALPRDFMKVAVKSRRNIVIAGSTGAGKTTLLIALCEEIPASERLVTIEDAAELNLRSVRHPDVVSLEAREANSEGVGEVSMVDLARHALRLGPDRVIVGETRGAEVESMISAMGQGNDGSMCTVHAMPGQALERLRTLLYKAYPNTGTIMPTDMVAQAVHFVFHCAITRDGERRVTSIRETTGREGENFSSNEVFRWDHKTKQLVPTGALSEQHRVLFADYGFPVQELGVRR